jgi:sulfate permease, SulP family
MPPAVAPQAQAASSRRWRPPLFQGLLPFDKSRLIPDIMAGVTLAALGIPEVMGYTKIIGTPIITGLYTLLLPVLAFACFGSSRHLVVSADSATAAMVAAALGTLAYTACTPEYVALTSLVGLAAAGMLLVARVLRLGFLADFLSRTVLVGFLSGVGLQVAFSQLNGMLGLEGGGHGFLGHLWHTVQHLPDTRLPYLGITLVVLGVIVGCEIFVPRFPGALLAVVGMIAASAAFHWGANGIAVVGQVPGGLPRLGLPDVGWSDTWKIFPVAFSCFIVILAQSAATSRAYALRYRDRFSQNTDLVGLALANAAAGCSSTFVVNGSPTKTAMVDTAGGRSQVTHLATATMVLLVLLFLTKPLSHLPETVLAAIVFMIGVKLVDYRGLTDILRRKPMEFGLAVVTAATVVLVGVEQGILLALVLSLLQHVGRSYKPHSGVVLTDPVDHWRIVPAGPEKELIPGLVLYWFGAELFYANASHFAEQARSLAADSPGAVRWLAVDASAITAVDFSGGSMLRELHQDLARQNVALVFTRLSSDLRKDLDQLGLTAVIGEKRLFSSRRECLEAYQHAQADHAPPLVPSHA